MKAARWVLAATSVCWLALVVEPVCTSAFQAAPGRGQPTPEQLAEQRAIQQGNQEDHQNMMDQLHIASLRPGVNARVVGSTNYDESKANPYPDLPDPLVMKDGKTVATAKMWWERRRPEIAEDFDREIYGRVPKTVPKVTWKVTGTRRESVGGIAVIAKTVVGHVDNSSYRQIAVDIQLSLSTSADAKGPVPVIVVFGPAPPEGQPPPAVSPAMQGAPEGPSWQLLVAQKGWGFASLNPASIQADNGAGFRKGIIGLVNQGQFRKPDDWGALRAWAWGADRALDYLATDKAVDATRIGIEGHSRYGKATIVTMAYDTRFAIAFVSSAGTGGDKIMRRNYGQIVENLAGPAEYHWMAGNFIKFGGSLKWTDLPVDAHELIAMCAPRPVFLSVGNLVDPAIDIRNSDAWTDARGTFMAGVAAGPVYRLLGKKDLGTSVFPPIDTGILDGDIAFRQHSAGHTPNPNWPYFLDFAEREFKSVSRPAARTLASNGRR
jgi:hypothetical protein